MFQVSVGSNAPVRSGGGRSAHRGRKLRPASECASNYAPDSSGGGGSLREGRWTQYWRRMLYSRALRWLCWNISRSGGDRSGLRDDAGSNRRSRDLRFGGDKSIALRAGNHSDHRHLPNSLAVSCLFVCVDCSFLARRNRPGLRFQSRRGRSWACALRRGTAFRHLRGWRRRLVLRHRRQACRSLSARITTPPTITATATAGIAHFHHILLRGGSGLATIAAAATNAGCSTAVLARNTTSRQSSHAARWFVTRVLFPGGQRLLDVAVQQVSREDARPPAVACAKASRADFGIPWFILLARSSLYRTTTCLDLAAKVSLTFTVQVADIHILHGLVGLSRATCPPRSAVCECACASQSAARSSLRLTVDSCTRSSFAISASVRRSR